MRTGRVETHRGARDARQRSTGDNTGFVLEPTPQIICIDCGGRCFLLTHPREDGIWEPGDVIAYRCEDCLDRWDIVMSDEDDAEMARGDQPDI